MKENDIIKQILQVLWTCNVFAWQDHEPWQGMLPRNKAGVADILGIFEGKPLAIEVKGPRGKLKAHQHEWGKRFVLEKGIYILAYQPEDVIEALGLNVKLAPLFAKARDSP